MKRNTDDTRATIADQEESESRRGSTISILTRQLDVPFWRTLKSNGRRERVGKFGVDLGQRGIYDKRNQLNDLTGKEWIYFLNSVWVTAYPPIAGKSSAFDLRKVHPSPKPPELMRDIILFFTKPGQKILDPLAGVGGSLLGASLCKPPRKAIGVELNGRYTRAYRRACKAMNATKQRMICGDARRVLASRTIQKDMFDLIVTDPPYSNMMNRPKNGQKKKLYDHNDPTPFSFDKRDIGNLPYEEYLPELRKILELAVSRLKPKKYMIVFSRDLQPSDSNQNLLHADVIRELAKIPNMRYRGLRIWHDQAVDLYPFGYPYAFVMNQMHQYILVFRKER
jgi:DNA modification methylase